MVDVSTLLARVPDESKPLVAVAIGSVILVFLVIFHGSALHAVLTLNKRGQRRLLRRSPRVLPTFFLFGSTVFLMLFLHVLGVIIWGSSLLKLGFIPHPMDAFYFCANAYTTLGYGNVDLGSHWRNLAPMMGLSGLFTFAWTTSALVEVAATHTNLIERREAQREKEREAHLR